MIPFPELEKIAEPQAPPVEQAVAWWWWIGAVALVLVLLAVFIWGLRTFLRRRALPAAPGIPERLALREIKTLRRRSENLTALEFAGALSGIVRAFLHRRMGMLARFATTEEILGRSRRGGTVPPPPLVNAFASVLEGCDALKFGSGHTDSRDALMTDAESAIGLVAEAMKIRPAPGTAIAAALSVPALPPLPVIPPAAPHAPPS